MDILQLRNCYGFAKIDRAYRDLTSIYIFSVLYIVSKCLWFV